MVTLKTTSVRDKELEEEELFVVSRLGKVGGSADDDDYHDDDDDHDNEDEDRQEASHAQLLSDMMKLTKKKKMQQEVRTTLSSSTTVDTSHLLSRLGPSTGMKKDRQTHTLPLPVEKTVARRIKRAAGYENVAMEANKWAKLVKVRREADQLHFPLERTDLSLKTVEKADVVQMKTPLEKEVYSLLQGAKLLPEKKETEQEEMARKALSLQEIRERNRELWRQKEMKRRYEQKARMMNKSKSRKYHRLLRRERLKKQRAELEELQKTDPEAALERLQELEAARIEERMSLRHKTSKWAHLQGFRATRDKNAMAALRENQRMHEQLTAKSTTKPEESGGEEEHSDDGDATTKDKGVAEAARQMEESQNPWLKHLSRSQPPKETPEDASFTKFKKFWEEVNRRNQEAKEMEERREREKQEGGKLEKKNVGEENNVEDKNRIVDKDVQKETQSGKEVDDEGDKINEKENNKGNEEEDEVEGNKNKNGGKDKQRETEEEEEDSGKTKKKRNRKKNKRKQVQEESNEGEKETTKHSADKEDKGGENKSSKSKRKKKNRKKSKTIQLCGDEALSIDKLFDEVEVGIKNKVMKKLKKMGVKTEEPWKGGKKETATAATGDTAAAEIDEFDFTSMRNQENTDERLGRAKTLQDLDTIEGESEGKLEKAVKVLKDSTTQPTTTTPSKRKLQVDPNNFMQVDAKKLMTELPDGVGEAGEAMDDEEGTEEKPEDIIREAFADDYLVEEFNTEKSEAVKKDQVGMSMALPGWGDWTGPNIKMSKTKIKRFRLRIPQAARKDSQLGNVLYNESADVHSNLRKAMVTELPYPFKSVKDFEASVRAPVGQQFMPVSAHKRLTAPPVVTKIGTVIQPMTEEELLRQEETNRGRRKKDWKDEANRGRKRRTTNTSGHNTKKSKQNV